MRRRRRRTRRRSRRWPIGWRHRKARNSIACANTCRNRCSASSSLCLVPSVSAARARQGPRRVEPRDHGLEPQADVHPSARPLRRGEGFLPQNEGERDRYRHSRAQHTLIGGQIDGSATGTLTHRTSPENRVRQAARARPLVDRTGAGLPGIPSHSCPVNADARRRCHRDHQAGRPGRADPEERQAKLPAGGRPAAGRHPSSAALARPVQADFAFTDPLEPRVLPRGGRFGR